MEVLTNKKFWDSLNALVDRVMDVKRDANRKTYNLYLRAAILRYVLSAATLGCVVYLFKSNSLTETTAIPLLMAIVASLFVPPRRSD